ncbi:MAG TPA: STAS domain-containing protein [bacterium]|jgi:anti-sigma B factor antagonist|nr:STAS domain-containing protein [bacterium]
MNACLLEARVAMSNTSVSVVSLSGSLDINTVMDFETVIADLFKQKRFKIVLNLEKLTYISSAGIGVLIGSIKDFRKNHGDIKLSHVGPDIYKVFDLLELPRIFQLLKTEQDAVNSF